MTYNYVNKEQYTSLIQVCRSNVLFYSIIRPILSDIKLKLLSVTFTSWGDDI